MIRSALRGRTLCNFLITPIPLLAFAIFSVIWWPKFSFSSNYIPKCLWFEQQDTGISFKKTAGCDALAAFLENITSWACLEKSGLKDIFHW